MSRKTQATVTCQICKQPKTPDDVLPAEFVRPTIAELIREDHGAWTPDGFVCLADLSHYRTLYVQRTLEADKGDLTTLEAEVLQSLKEHELLTANVNAEFEREVTLGQRLADRVAEFGGSWTFLLMFAGVLVVWVAVNSLVLLWRPFDPYPFILLNLLLSCLAAVQAPVIMMSQNRQEAKDRLRGEHDYRVNLKAELEIRHLHAKIDLLLTHQWQRLLEIQEIQVELMEQLAQGVKSQASG